MELSKSRLSALVVGSTAAGHLMSSGPLDLTSLASALGGTFLLAGSANSFNQIIETRNDAAMNRTHKRPLPSGRISRPHAIGWASASGAAGLATLALGTNCMTTALGAATLGLYTLAYTPMKQRTPLNTWVGAVVGAIPPVMGWTAAGGGLITLEAAVLGSSLFLWQMPHFFALSWMYRSDYAQGGYQMVPLHDPTGARTSQLCLEYSLYLAALPPLCWATGLTSCMFAIDSIGFNGMLLFAAWRFYSNSSRGQAHARRLFLASLAYLPIFFGCLLLHQKRLPAEMAIDEDARLPAPAESLDRLLVEESLTRLRERGRDLCIHEHVVTGGGNSTDPARCPMPLSAERSTGAQAETADTSGMGGGAVMGRGAVMGTSGMGGSAGRCPVVVAEHVAETVVQQAAQQATQQQQRAM